MLYLVYKVFSYYIPWHQ